MKGIASPYSPQQRRNQSVIFTTLLWFGRYMFQPRRDFARADREAPRVRSRPDFPASRHHVLARPRHRFRFRRRPANHPAPNSLSAGVIGKRPSRLRIRGRDFRPGVAGGAGFRRVTIQDANPQVSQV